MKRIGNLHNKIYSLENIELADSRARRNKSVRYGINRHDKNKDEENIKLSESIRDLVYLTSEYSTFTIHEPKERLIYRLPYYPDRITHHAIMNIMEPIWTKIFITNTYSAIKGRGIHKVEKDLFKVLLKDYDGTLYCLKMDVRKFYPSIKHDILFEIILKKIKDEKVLTLLKEIIYSTDGVPIGNYLSLFFANLYLAYFDHWVKEELKCKYYFRYADDIVILSNDKNKLRNILLAIKIYLTNVLDLLLKNNYQIYPVESRGIDFVGYKFYHTRVLLRKSIKKNMFKLINKYKNNKIDKERLERGMLSYFGWMKACNSKHLLLKVEELTGLHYSNWNGKEVNISNFYGRRIHIVEVVEYSKHFRIHFIYHNTSYFVKSQNKALLRVLKRCQFPNNFTLREYVDTQLNKNECSAQDYLETWQWNLLF